LYLRKKKKEKPQKPKTKTPQTFTLKNNKRPSFFSSSNSVLFLREIEKCCLGKNFFQARLKDLGRMYLYREYLSI